MANFCIVDGNAEQVTVRGTANNGLRTGVTFWLWEKQGDNYEPIIGDQHNGATGDPGVWTFNLNTPVSNLEGKVLTWRAQSCLFIPETERASLKIEFFQGNVKCKTTKEFYPSRDYPQCSTGKVQPQEGEVMFTLFHNQPIEKLWERML